MSGRLHVHDVQSQDRSESLVHLICIYMHILHGGCVRSFSKHNVMHMNMTLRFDLAETLHTICVLQRQSNLSNLSRPFFCDEVACAPF